MHKKPGISKKVSLFLKVGIHFNMWRTPGIYPIFPGMQVIHLCPSKSFSGLEQYVHQLAQWQNARLAVKVIVVVAPGSRLESECAHAGIRTVPAKNFVSLTRDLVSLLNEDPQTIFHLHTTHEVYNVVIPALFYFLKSKHPPKVVMQFHLWITHKKKDPFHWLLYSLVNEIWCSSETARDSLQTLLPVHADKLKVIRYGRPIQSRLSQMLAALEAREELGLPPDAVVFGGVANVHPLKGQFEAVQAIEPLLENEAKLHLVLIGGARPDDRQASLYESKLRTFINQSPLLSERIHLFGNIEDVFRYLKAFNVFILPSYLECFSLAMLDAQLASLPLIGTRAGGTPDVVAEGKTGWLAEPADVPSLRSAMERAFQQRSAWGEMGDRASERVRQEFNQDRIFEFILGRYERILKA